MLEKGINSYLSLDEADELIAYVDTGGAWKELSEDKREQYLILATLHIDSLILSSHKHNPQQPLQFPRRQSTEIPRAVLAAQAFEALALSDTQSAQRVSLQEQGVTSIKLGNTSESYSDSAVAQAGARQLMSKQAYNLMRPFMLGSAAIV